LLIFSGILLRSRHLDYSELKIWSNVRENPGKLKKRSVLPCAIALCEIVVFQIPCIKMQTVKAEKFLCEVISRIFLFKSETSCIINGQYPYKLLITIDPNKIIKECNKVAELL